MSVIAYDGKTIAADRRMVSGEVKRTSPKLFKIRGSAVGFVGIEEVGQLLVQWFRDGSDPKGWPEKAQDNENDRSLLIVANRHGIGFYNQYATICQIYEEFWAWGCGRGLALGAMAMGASAERAVEVACQLDIYCGNGVDVFTLADLPGDTGHKKNHK